MKKLFILSMCALLAAPVITHAQLGGLKNKIKDKVSSDEKNKTTETKTTASPQPENPPPAQTAPGPPPAAAKAKEPSPAAEAEIDFKQHPFPPTLKMSAMLEDGFKIHSDQPTPFFFLPRLIFLPTRDVAGHEVNYENEKYIYGVIKQGDKVLYKEYLEPIGNSVPEVGLKRSDRLEVERPANGLESGNYTCEVVLGGRTIFSMPFEMILVKNDDVYASEKEFRLMDGYWSKYGFISFTPDGLLLWNTYEANMDRKFVERGVSQSKDCKVEQQLFYNGQPVSKVDEASYSVPRGEWTLESTTLVNINSTKTTNYLKKEDLKDGAWVLKMKINGEQREYAFNVKGGKPEYIPEQDKTKTQDLAKVFEGTNKEFWVKRTR